MTKGNTGKEAMRRYLSPSDIYAGHVNQILSEERKVRKFREQLELLIRNKNLPQAQGARNITLTKGT